MKFWSGWLTTISCITMLISITIASVVYGKIWQIWYLMQGAYGSFFGIIAGPLGISASNAKRLSTTKCLWTSHIVLCVFTIIGSMIGFSFGILGLIDTSSEIRDDYYGCDFRACAQMYALMAIENFLCFITIVVAIICTWSFGCAKCCCGGCKTCCSPLPSFKQVDYEESSLKLQTSISTAPIISQPSTQPMLTIAQPMSVSGQIVQTPYGQAFILPSNTTMMNGNHGQVYAQSTSLSQEAVHQEPAGIGHFQPPVDELNTSKPMLETGTNHTNTSNKNDHTINDSSKVESKDF